MSRVFGGSGGRFVDLQTDDLAVFGQSNFYGDMNLQGNAITNVSNISANAVDVSFQDLSINDVVCNTLTTDTFTANTTIITQLGSNQVVAADPNGTLELEGNTEKAVSIFNNNVIPGQASYLAVKNQTGNEAYFGYDGAGLTGGSTDDVVIANSNGSNINLLVDDGGLSQKMSITKDGVNFSDDLSATGTLKLGNLSTNETVDLIDPTDNTLHLLLGKDRYGKPNNPPYSSYRIRNNQGNFFLDTIRNGANGDGYYGNGLLYFVPQGGNQYNMGINCADPNDPGNSAPPAFPIHLQKDTGVDGDLTVQGDLDVQGSFKTFTSISSTELEILPEPFPSGADPDNRFILRNFDNSIINYSGILTISNLNFPDKGMALDGVGSVIFTNNITGGNRLSVLDGINLRGNSPSETSLIRTTPGQTKYISNNTLTTFFQVDRTVLSIAKDKVEIAEDLVVNGTISGKYIGENDLSGNVEIQELAVDQNALIKNNLTVNGDISLPLGSSISRNGTPIISFTPSRTTIAGFVTTGQTRINDLVVGTKNISQSARFTVDGIADISGELYTRERLNVGYSTGTSPAGLPPDDQPPQLVVRDGADISGNLAVQTINATGLTKTNGLEVDNLATVAGNLNVLGNIQCNAEGLIGSPFTNIIQVSSPTFTVLELKENDVLLPLTSYNTIFLSSAPNFNGSVKFNIRNRRQGTIRIVVAGSPSRVIQFDIGAFTDDGFSANASNLLVESPPGSTAFTSASSITFNQPGFLELCYIGAEQAPTLIGGIVTIRQIGGIIL